MTTTPAAATRAAAKRLLFRILPANALLVPKSLSFRWRHRLGILYDAASAFLPKPASSLGWITPGPVVLDVGGNIGQYSAVFAKLVGKDGMVHTLEPMPHRPAALADNLRRLRVQGVRPHAVAAWSEAGTFQLLTPIRGGRPLHQESPLRQQSADDQRESIDTTRIAALGLTSSAFITMDVEGAELPAPHGAQELLKNHHSVPMLEVERDFCARFGYAPADITTFLADLAYAPVRLVGDQRQPLAPSDAVGGNVFFVPGTRT